MAGGLGTRDCGSGGLGRAMLFQKSLTDLIKGIRANPQGEPEFIASCLAECRQELTSVEAMTKQTAVLKLIYMQMLGHDVTFGAFHMVDVMSSPRYRAKRIGFLGAAQTFNDETDVLLLTTNLFRKAFASSQQHEASLALGCLAKIATADLARDLLTDVTNMLSSSRPLLRKKAVLALYRLLTRLPEALTQAFPRLRERLDDSDPAVVACTVNVLTELATDNPKGYLGLAPALYKVLTTSTSNWTLIKVVKFLRQLVPHEPRLAKKLVQPLTHLIETTPAKSLQFECLYTVATTMAATQPELAALTASKLKEFLEASDANLKSLGLLALAALQASDKALITPCHDAVLLCLDDEPSVRAAALALIAGMVTRTTLASLVMKLLGQVEGAASTYRDEVIAVILSSVRADGFAHVASFKWLVTTLYAVAALESKHGVEVARLLFEVTLRVPTIRAFAAEASVDKLLSEPAAAAAAEPSTSFVGFSTPHEQRADAALLAASFVVGEHSALLPADRQLAALHALLSPRVLRLRHDVQASYVQAATRVFSQLPSVAAASAADDDDLSLAEFGDGELPAEIVSLMDVLSDSLLPFCSDSHPEVTERACGMHELLTLVRRSKASDARAFLKALRTGMAAELKAVAPKAQRKVKPPPELDLLTPLYTPTPEDWATLGLGPGGAPCEASPANEPPRTPDARGGAEAGGSAGPSTAQSSSERRPRPAAVGPYYLPADPRTSMGAAADDVPSGGLDAATSVAAAAGGGMAGSALPVCASFGDEEDSAAAVVDLHEDMPDGAGDSDDEPSTPPRKPGAAPPARAAHAAAAPGRGPMLIDLLGEPDPPAAAPAAEEGGDEGGRRRRRRKHRSGGGGAEQDLVTF